MRLLYMQLCCQVTLGMFKGLQQRACTQQGSHVTGARRMRLMATLEAELLPASAGRLAVQVTIHLPSGTVSSIYCGCTMHNIAYKLRSDKP